MKTIKGAQLILAGGYCKYPEGIDNIKDFVDCMNEHYNSFVELEIFEEKDCVDPYFIEGKTQIKYFNPSRIMRIEEAEIHVCSESEYEQKLKDVIANKCINCAHFIDDDELDWKSHRNNINLDGVCYSFERKEDRQHGCMMDDN